MAVRDERRSPPPPNAAPAGGNAAFRDHYAASQFRIEIWNVLKHQTDDLLRAADERRDVEPLRVAVEGTLRLLDKIEVYWAFPGTRTCRELSRLCERSWFGNLHRHAAWAVRLLVSDAYRQRDLTETRREDSEDDREPRLRDDRTFESGATREGRPYFEVLVVDDISADEETELRRGLLDMRSEDDEFIYDVVVVRSFEDAVIAVLFNHNIQSALVRYRFPVASRIAVPELRHYVEHLGADVREAAEQDPSGTLAGVLEQLRPELDLFRVTDDTPGSVVANRARAFRRVFYRQEDYVEQHLSILKGIRERFDTPFFHALREYSHKPAGVFHALPVARGKSIANSHWIRDMGRFYGRNVFLAETSSTTGGLDSLLAPTGSLKRAQEKAARAYGSRRSYFVTNGTSTANKIVTQALVRPGDFVLLSHDCHKSHPYALVLAGALPVYLDAYPLHEFTMFGGVPLREIKRQLIRLRAAGKLDRVRLLLLTNSTFDGIVYDPYRVMAEILAIKPDMIFLWDEAWFAFARATPTYRRRTGMDAAARLREEFARPDAVERWEAWKREFDTLDPDDDTTWLDQELRPDPRRARVRVYATQSTHKTLTSLRQGSMIHVHDQDFEQQAREAFNEAYMTHTSTSPNYQILASLDVGRRQLELEGYELVRQTVGLAMMLRKQVNDDPLLNRYFRVLKVKDMIPAVHRPSGLEKFYDPATGFTRMERHWREDEFALDPTRITLNIGATGMDGDTFRRMLMDRFDIQVNKTTRNTVLFLVNIGTNRGSATYLLDVLLQVARELDEQGEDQSELDRTLAADRVSALLDRLPPLPHFSRFHPAFVPDPTGGTPEGDMRAAFFLAYDAHASEHLHLDGSVAAAMASGREVVSASFVTPYPPGFPVLVPGQVISADILDYLLAVDVKEIHGYEPQHGLRVFRQDVLDALTASSAPTPSRSPDGPTS